ncbi:MAG: VOC family protein [Aliiglaciecola sp.]|uniref:VOC family protein n=1 Tax=Aliiglaciecola sp. TaxID=1872441 RepID=UPI0032972AD9
MQTSHASVSALIRATIFVRDLNVALRFYRALGMSESYYEGDLEHPSASAVLGFEQHYPYPIKILKVAGPNFGMLGLFQLAPEHNAQQVPIATGAARVGEVALVFYVPNLDDILPRLKQLGAAWLPKPEQFEMGSISQREVCIRDADGTLLNLVERDPNMQNLRTPEMEF